MIATAVGTRHLSDSSEQPHDTAPDAGMRGHGAQPLLELCGGVDGEGEDGADAVGVLAVAVAELKLEHQLLAVVPWAGRQAGMSMAQPVVWFRTMMRTRAFYLNRKGAPVLERSLARIRIIHGSPGRGPRLWQCSRTQPGYASAAPARVVRHGGRRNPL